MEGKNPENNQNRINKAKMRRDYLELARKRAMNIKMHNTAVRHEARREVRRPGRDYSRLFQAIDQLIGTVEDKREVIHEVIEEALRFKRRILAQQLEDYILEMQMNDNIGRAQICPHCAILRARSRRHCKCNGRNIG